MNKWQDYFIKYLNCYVRSLTEGKDEYFLSFCDVEEELLDGLDTSSLSEYCVIIVNNKDYSQAVRMRNTVEVSKIVLLSGEGIKQIDSLKDFNEYPIMAENREVLWKCLLRTFDLVRFSDGAKTFLSAVLDYSEIALSTLIKYLDKSVVTFKLRKTVSVTSQKKRDEKASPRRILSPEKMNVNLPVLGMWRSNQSGYLKKGETGRILRASRYNVVESRLTKAVMNGMLAGLGIEKPVTEGLASGRIENIFEKVDYEDVKDFLKIPSKGTPSSDTRPADTEEIFYENSYQYQLLTDSGKAVADIEADWIADKEQEDSDEEQQWKNYHCTEEELKRFEEQYTQLKKEVCEMNLEEALIQEIGRRLQNLQKLFVDSWAAVTQATPVCLDRFCESASGYTQEYLELLAFILGDVRVRSAIVGTDISQMLQGLFCQVEGATVEMPFYHPVCVLYHMCVRKMYQYAVGQQEKDGRDMIKDQTWLAMIERAGRQFPIEYMAVNGKTYALDHATVWQKGKVVFTDQSLGTVYSSLDFRTISSQLLEYMERHPFLTYIRITVMDISDLSGLVQLVNRIRHISQTEESNINIGKVEFLILSAREEELKKEMAQLWDGIGTEEIIRFRFDRNGYWNGKQYNMKQIIEESDIIVIADNSMLYREPRTEIYQNNGFKNRLQDIHAEKQAERYFGQPSLDVAVIWDTLQYIAQNRGEGYRIWKNREIDNGLLAEINRTVSDCPDKAIILLSSNEHILSEIFRTRYIHAHQGGYNSRSITIIEYEKDNQRKLLPDHGEAKVTYSLKDFYETTLGLEKIQEKVSDSLEDIRLEFGYQDGKFYCNCAVVTKYSDEPDREWEKQCMEWLQWQFTTLISKDNVLGIYYRDALMNCLLEQAPNLPSVLLIERLFREDFRQIIGDITRLFMMDKKQRDKSRTNCVREKDCMEALKLHEIMLFAGSKAGIDEEAVSQFKDRYETELLQRLLSCDEKYGLLPSGERDKLLKIQERI